MLASGKLSPSSEDEGVGLILEKLKVLLVADRVERMLGSLSTLALEAKGIVLTLVILVARGSDCVSDTAIVLPKDKGTELTPDILWVLPPVATGTELIPDALKAQEVALVLDT